MRSSAHLRFRRAPGAGFSGSIWEGSGSVPQVPARLHLQVLVLVEVEVVVEVVVRAVVAVASSSSSFITTCLLRATIYIYSLLLKP